MKKPEQVSEAVRRLNPDLYCLINPGQHHPQPAPVKPVLPPVLDFTYRPTTAEEKLNKLERRYLAQLRRLLPQGAYIGIQNLRFVLAFDCTYTPDFSYLDCNGRLRFIDTKASRKDGKMLAEDDAIVKIKTAARIFRWADWYYAVERNGQFEEIQVKP